MLARLCAVALVAAAAPHAHAETCYGTANTRYVCPHPENVSFDPDGGPAVGDCVYVNADECVPVFVTAPSAGLSGPLVSLRCGDAPC
ncbi:MAG TPA: hypothetical protein VGX28_05070 [Frankiaceae bacterium]|jgi:hypothetical protein|nr:hypothetical protein [Frankiaceae bacterium]